MTTETPKNISCFLHDLDTTTKKDPKPLTAKEKKALEKRKRQEERNSATKKPLSKEAKID